MALKSQWRVVLIRLNNQSVILSDLAPSLAKEQVSRRTPMAPRGLVEGVFAELNRSKLSQVDFLR